jgi:hypothetical protein
MFFITDQIFLMKRNLALQDESSDSPVDEIRRGWHGVSRHSMKLHFGISLLGLTLLMPILGDVAVGQTVKDLYNFQDLFDGAYPIGDLVLDQMGNLYGVTRRGPYCNGFCPDEGTVFRLHYDRKTGVWHQKLLYEFTGRADGGEPYAGVTFDQQGNLYGTTTIAGNALGNVFKLSPVTGKNRWNEQVLFTFASASGYFPTAGVVLDATGNVYGTTNQGGDLTCDAQHGCGTVFKLTPQPGGGWTETTIYTFHGSYDGYSPYGSVTLDANGNVFGTTEFGGDLSCNVYGSFGRGCGVVFELSESGGVWKEKVLHTFKGLDGAFPETRLLLGSHGILYGTTGGGGNGNLPANGGLGTVFALTPLNGGWKEAVLYKFTGGADGAFPVYSDLISDTSGDLYGTTYLDSVFELVKIPSGGWNNRVLVPASGNGPVEGGLVLDGQGNLYGSVNCCANQSIYGYIFEVTP